MTKPHLLLIAALPPWFHQELEQRFEVHGPFEGAAAEAFWAGQGAQVRAVVTTGSHGVANAVLDALPGLEIVSAYGVGVDQIDLPHAKARGVTVTNTPDVLTDDVADLAIALTLAVQRRIAANDRFVRDGRWESGERVPLGRKVSGSRVGILGLGRIGRAIARRFEGFTDQIRYHSRNPVEGAPYPYEASAESLAAYADILVVATSGGPEARRLVDAEVLAALGAQGVLINISRGAVVDQDALVSALAEGKLAGAGLDVFEDEPNTPHALWAMEQVVLQPHQGSATEETRRAMGERVLQNLDAWLAGREPPDRVV
ncbi:2-hydroxyacid dehydrogenase [Phenylobacterium deserti]|uniref:2-hydroxyacid dehydrogenase n=1 Tax=Phenylobacterium deserti TaxID=1914756 RepID=A0A328A9E4_9CAUL|nr:2-hydroxyacid dehydrogenase [Phenylobacterium deserti]RAK50756.1 2-hydroxyacid dehydrogenase [Phenylobacterium deserti]